MRAEPDSRLERRLSDLLHEEADRVPVRDEWSGLRTRLRTGAPPAVRRRRWRGPVLAAVALGLVVTCLVVLTTGGLRRTAAPARSPLATAVPSTPAATPAPTARATGGYRASSPRVAWTVYRVGADGLVLDAARATAPFDPAQALTALFDQPADVPGAVDVPGSSRNRVAGLTVVDDVVHLDMAAVDDRTRPPDPATARRWVESWVRTADDALGVFGPVLITLQGRPTTLYGSVDTSEPLFDPRAEVAHPAAIYFPGDAEEVTSPVAVAAMPSAVGDRLVVQDAASATEVLTLTADASGGGRTALTAAPALPTGTYTAVLRHGSGQVLDRQRFTVVGTAPRGGRTPVTDPPTVRVGTTLAYYPGPGGRLLAEPRPRTTLAAAVAEISGEPVSDGASWPFGSLTPATVVERDGEVVVDYVADDHVVPGKPDAAVARFWVQSLTHTVAAYLGRDVPVRVTLRGAPFRLFGLLDTGHAFDVARVGDRLPAGLTLPTAVPGPSPVAVVGATDDGVDHVTWYVLDSVTRETLYQGTAAVDHDVYGFGLPLPVGRYDLRVDQPRTGGTSARSFGRGIEVV